MNRRTFLAALAGGPMFGGGFAGGSERVNGLRAIGWLYLGQAWNLGTFRARLRELGWIEGKNLAIEARWADNDRDRLPALAADLVDRKVDVLVTQTTLAAHAAKEATSTIPIVMAGSNNPVTEGLVASMTRPGKNVTGVMHSPPALGQKMVQLLKQAAPQVTRIAVLERAVDGGTTILARAAGDLGVMFKMTQVESHDDVAAALAAALRWGANALFVPPTAMNDNVERLIADFALAHRWASVGGSRSFAERGGLMSYWASWREIRRQAADYVDKILRGANPGELPIEQPTKFEFVLNLRTARKLGLTIPQSIRLRADELIA
jgi:putative ABC transport system substrate-binding protein